MSYISKALRVVPFLIFSFLAIGFCLPATGCSGETMGPSPNDEEIDITIQEVEQETSEAMEETEQLPLCEKKLKGIEQQELWQFLEKAAPGMPDLWSDEVEEEIKKKFGCRMQ
jgi:hypothetical protein